MMIIPQMKPGVIGAGAGGTCTTGGIVTVTSGAGSSTVISGAGTASTVTGGSPSAPATLNEREAQPLRNGASVLTRQ